MKVNKGKMAGEYSLSDEYSPIKEQIDIGIDYTPAIGEYTVPEKEFSDTTKEFEYSTEEIADEDDGKKVKDKINLIRKMSYMVASAVAIVVIGQAASHDAPYIPDVEIEDEIEGDIGYGEDYDENDYEDDIPGYIETDFGKSIKAFVGNPEDTNFSFENMYSIDGVKNFAKKQGLESGETDTISNTNVYYTEAPRQYVDGRVEEGATLTFSGQRKGWNSKKSYTSFEYTGTALTKLTTHIIAVDDITPKDVEDIGGFSEYLRKNNCLTVKDLLLSFGFDEDSAYVSAAEAEEATATGKEDSDDFGKVSITVESEVAMYGDLYTKSMKLFFAKDSGSPYKSIYITEGFPANYLGEVKSFWINAYPWEEEIEQETEKESESVAEKDKDIADQDLMGSVFKIPGYILAHSSGGIIATDGNSELYTYSGEKISVKDVEWIRKAYVWDGYVYADSPKGKVIINPDGEVVWNENETILRLHVKGERCEVKVQGISGDILCYTYVLRDEHDKEIEDGLEMYNLKNKTVFLNKSFPGGGIFDASAFYDGKIVIIEEASEGYEEVERPLEDFGTKGYPFKVLYANGAVTSLGEVGQWMEIREELPTKYILMLDHTKMMMGEGGQSELVLIDLDTGERKYRIDCNAVEKSQPENIHATINGYYKVNKYNTSVYETYSLMLTQNHDTYENKYYLVDFRDADENGLVTKRSEAYDRIYLDDTIYLRTKNGENYYYIDFEGRQVGGPYKAASLFTKEGYAAVSNENGVVQIVDKNFNVVDTVYNAIISEMDGVDNDDIIFLKSTLDLSATYVYYYGEKYK